MNTQPKYPFQLNNIFYKSLQFKRAPEVPQPIELQLDAQLKLHEDRLPEHLQLDLRVGTSGDPEISFHVELIGIFSLVEGHHAPDKDAIRQFVNDQALFMFFPVVQNVVRAISAGMSVNPIEIPIPYHFEFPYDTAEGNEEEE